MSLSILLWMDIGLISQLEPLHMVPPSSTHGATNIFNAHPLQELTQSPSTRPLLSLPTRAGCHETLTTFMPLSVPRQAMTTYLPTSSTS